MGGGGGKGVGATWPDTVKQSGAGGTLTPADRHGSVQVSLPAHLSSIFHCLYLFLSCHFVFYFAKSFSFFSRLFCIFSFLVYGRFTCNRWKGPLIFSDATTKRVLL